MENQKPKILIVDDQAENLFMLERLLREIEATVIQANSSFEALALTLEHDFCVVIMDVQLSEVDGYELATLLRGNRRTSTLPIIFVSASDEYHHRIEYEAGAIDFLRKPFAPEILLSKVRIFVNLYNQQRKLQALVDQLNQAGNALSRHTLQLEASYQVSHRTTQILDLTILLEEVVQLMRAEFDYAAVGIWLQQAGADALTLEALSCKGKDDYAELGAIIPCGKGQDIVARVYRTKEVQMDPSGRSEDIHLQIMEGKEGYSELALPLKVGEKMIGVLDIQSDQEAVFDVIERKVLQTMADQVAVAVHNVWFYTQVTHFNEALESIVQERTAELEKAYQRLELLDRKRTEFIQIISHELRTPLSLVMGYGQMLMCDSQIEDDEIYDQQVSGIVKGAERMQDIVDGMLDIVRIDNKALELVMEWVSISQLLAELRKKLYAPLIKRDLTLTFINIDSLPEIEADYRTIAKLFHHLLTNAIKFTPDGGTITVTGRVLNNTFPKNEGFVEITVSDTGIGIDPDFHDLIFTKFYQTGQVNYHSTGKTKFKGGGPGLGLAIAKGIVEAHGGHIWVESSGLDEARCPGSVFHVLLPIGIKKQERVMNEAILAMAELA